MNPIRLPDKKHIMTTVNKYGYARLHEDPLLHVPHAYIGEKVPVSYTATDVKIRYNYDIIAATGTTTAIPPLPSTSAPSTVQLWGGRPERFVEQAAAMHEDMERRVLEKILY